MSAGGITPGGAIPPVLPPPSIGTILQWQFPVPPPR